MGRANVAPLMRTQACVCGAVHPVIVVLMGAVVVQCPEIRDSALHVEHMEVFPHTWYLRTGPRGVKEVEKKKK